MLQLQLPIKKPGAYKGIMVDNEGISNFKQVIRDACSRPGLKCFFFILHPTHTICICINNDSVAVFDSHAFQGNNGAMIMFSTLSKVSNFLSVFHDNMKQGFGCTV